MNPRWAAWGVPAIPVVAAAVVFWLTSSWVCLLMPLAFLLGALIEATRQIRRLEALNQALMDGAARRLMNDVAPELAAALDRLGKQP